MSNTNSVSALREIIRKRTASLFVQSTRSRQGDVGTGAFGEFLPLTALHHHHHHFVQDVVRIALWDADMGRLQTGAYARDRAVVIGALDVDDFVKATAPFVDVIRHVRYKIGVAASALRHHAVFVIAKVGGAQPQCAALSS